MCISISFALFIAYGYGQDPPKQAKTNCTIFGCLSPVSGYHAFIMYKMAAGACNFIAGVTFITLWRLRRKPVPNGLFYMSVEEKKRRTVGLDILNKMIQDLINFHKDIVYF